MTRPVFDGSEFRAHAELDWQMEGVSVKLVQRSGGSIWVYSFDQNRVYSDAGSIVPDTEAHPLRLPEGGRPVTITDREDLKVERGRVDKLQDAVVAIALSKVVTA